ncbi:MAG: DUF4290 domain-containing protein [Bacteroidales bacterium]|jgi:hypothetical protein|nr:DUF4290 domain-containing protein [Bacteroidales bacterium]
MEYNTKRNKLIIREYGRNIQKLVEDCVKIEDRKERTRTAYAVVRIMSDVVNSKENSNETNRNNEDFWNKLWDHLFIMSDYQLDVDSPFPKPVPDTSEREFIKPSYNNKNKVRFRTYGVNMQNLIRKVSEYPENVRQQYAPSLANYLKMMYLTYNRNSVNDQLIRHQLSELSNEKINLPEDFNFVNTKELLNLVNSNQAFYVAPQSGTKKKKKKKKKKNNNAASV